MMKAVKGQAPAKEEIDAKKQYLTDLRQKIGTLKWCELYAAEMEEAHVILDFAKQNAELR